jgi:SHS2 domain-containing protein
MDKYKVIDHPSDIGIEAFGKDLTELFENSAFGMMDMMFDLKYLHPQEYILSKQFDVHVSADNLESLLIAWLSELLYISDANKIQFSVFNINKMTNNKLDAKVLGDKILKINRFIKAATYNQLEIKKEKDNWKARIIFDV